MDSYGITQQRPLTPPKDLKSNNVNIQADSDIPYIQRQGEETSLSDIPYLQRQQEIPSAPISQATPSTHSASAANPFLSNQQHDPLMENAPTQSRRAQQIHDPFNDIKSTSTTSAMEPTSHSTSLGGRNELNSTSLGGRNNEFKSTMGGRNDTTTRIEREVRDILKWKNPVRSGLAFGLSVGSILLTRWYSLVQIGASLLTLAIGINLVYVNFILQGQKLVSNEDASHPYNDLIHNEKKTMIDKQSVRHYSNILTDVSETMIRALTRIVFVENTATSLKWMGIFFAIWKISAHVSTMNIVLALVISAFIFPRLYISNKDVVDAHIQKGQTLIQTGINKAQNAAAAAAQDTYTKSRAFVAKAGTTGTDAKNTLSKSSVTVKED